MRDDTLFIQSDAEAPVFVIGLVWSYNVSRLVLDFMMDLEKSLVMSVNDNEEGIKDIVIQCQFLKGNLTFMF